jgi:hypothetical protein
MFTKGAKVNNTVIDVDAAAAATATTFPDTLSLFVYLRLYKLFNYKSN